MTGVWCDGIQLDASMYELVAGQLNIFADVLAAGQHLIFVAAEGYMDACVEQQIGF